MENSTLIAGIYRIIKTIGSGGGGTVYLALHTRLNKKVVLKASKRSSAKKIEKNRREVDMLKQLSHTYIPQVYDFVEEDGVAYAVMEYVDGESLDKPLRRYERFNQAQIIKCAMQLLEAVDYLHNRPPYGILHADIKPSNIMLTPQRDVRLIDFNIALRLGEEGAVAVGRSFGYASPEHYGFGAFSEKPADSNMSNDEDPAESTDLSENSPYEPRQALNSVTSDKNTKILDVRSDIYSLGATLYHMITNTRPHKDATKVIPIQATHCSPALVAIIEKAMNPNKDMRWQSAKDMLNAFKHMRDSNITFNKINGGNLYVKEKAGQHNSRHRFCCSAHADCFIECGGDRRCLYQQYLSGLRLFNVSQIRRQLMGVG